MSDTIQIKAGEKGSRTNLPLLSLRELGFLSDVENGSLYIGTASGNRLLCSVKRTEAPAFPGAVETVTELEPTATLEQAVTAINAILASLKAGGVMQT